MKGSKNGNKKLLVKKQKKQKKQHGEFLFGIAFKLFGLTLITVLCIVSLGIFSYQKASKTIVSNYETTTFNTVKEMGNYYSFLLTAAEQKSLELYNNENLVLFYGGYYDNEPTKEAKVYKDTLDQVKLEVLGSEYIDGINIIGKKGRNISTYGTIPDTAFENYTQTGEGKVVLDSKGVIVWNGSPKFIMELNKKDAESYGLSASRSLKSKNMSDVAFISIEISKDYILNSIESMELIDGSYLAVFSPEGRVYTTDKLQKNVPFNENEIFQGLKENPEDAGINYIKNDEFLQVHFKLGTTGVMISCIIPTSVLLEQANEIRTLTVVITTLAILITVSICIYISNGFNYNMKQINKATKLAAEGNLDVQVKTKRRDEFRILANHVTNMLGSMKHLIKEIFQVTNTVASSTSLVKKESQELNQKAIRISNTMQEIDKGITEQANSAMSCIMKMEQLSLAIANVVDNTNSIQGYSNKTNDILERGIHKVNGLVNQSILTKEITQSAMKDMGELQQAFSRIRKITESMNEIAEQTNLLSLNASIEAARAGKAGGGFSVVAEEIRKLSEASAKCSNQIHNISFDLQDKMNHALSTVEEAGKIVEEQGKSLELTADEFSIIGKHMEDLNNNITQISVDVGDMESARDVTKDAIETISVVLQQTSAATMEVLATAEDQVTTVEKLHSQIQSLESKSDGLLEAVSVFKIS